MEIQEIFVFNLSVYLLIINLKVLFGKYLKVGVVEDQRNKEDIIPLLRFWSIKSGDKYISLDAYVDEIPEGQTSIYYVSGEGKEKNKLQPVIENFYQEDMTYYS